MVLKQLKLVTYDILISDISMPDTDGLEMITSALALQPGLKILIVSVYSESIFAHSYLRAGAFGYVQKGESNEDLKKAIINLSQGKRFVTGLQTEIFANAFLSDRSVNPFDSHSGREFEVTLFLLKGYGVLEISNALGISNSTVSTYRIRVFGKLGIKNIMGLSKLASLHQIVIDYSISG